MKKITLFLVAVCTTVLMACGGSGFKSVIDLYEDATKKIASFESVEDLTAFEAEINTKAHEIIAAATAKGDEPTDEEMKQLPVVTAKYTEAIRARAVEIAE